MFDLSQRRIEIRPNSIGGIIYIIINSRSENSNETGIYNIPTNNRTNGLLQIGMFPRDIHQLQNSIEYYKISLSDPDLKFGYNLLLLDDESIIADFALDQYSEMLQFDKRVVVYIIDSTLAKKSEILQHISDNSGALWYYTTLTKDLPISDEKDRYFGNYKQLNKLLQRDLDKIIDQLGKESEYYKEINSLLTKSITIEKPDRPARFQPARSNHHTINQITSHFWQSEEHEQILIKHEDRLTYLLDSVKTLDILHNETAAEAYNFRGLPILVTIFPFLNPIIYKSFINRLIPNNLKSIIKHIKIEQDQKYEHVTNHDVPKEVGAVLINFVKPRLEYLDAVGYLHSTLTYSPVMRFPSLADSLYKELSYFNPSANLFQSLSARRKKIKSIKRFGEKLANLCLDKNISNYLQKTDRQIFAISDLPIEWLWVKNAPLGFTHDLCRIPETNYQGILNHYSMNNKVTYKIKPDILSRTLVVLAADTANPANHQFKITNSIIHQYKIELGFEIIEPSSIEELSAKVNDFKPELLIFDCHGVAESGNEISYLQINKEKLTGKKIVEHSISANIVILSCCNSDQIYGSINKLNDAFAEVGAFTVTGTFMPITVIRGALYYRRLLELLSREKTKYLFPNWLAFCSHVIRTSFLHDAFRKAASKQDRELTRSEQARLSSYLFKCVKFETRRKVFTDLMGNGLKLSDKLSIRLEDTESEFLMYSHYGRPDLLLFNK